MRRSTLSLILVLLAASVYGQGIGPVTGGARGIRTFSFNNANGFTGVVTNPTTTPSLTLTLDAGAITLDSIEDIATNSVIGRNDGGSGQPEQLTASEVLDMIGNTRGAILYRGAAGWSILAPGTVNNILISGGAGADPSWATDVNEKTANKGAVSGYASLDGSSKLTSSQIPTTVELQANKGAISGYAPLNASQIVPAANLGTGGSGAGSKFLADNGTFQTLAGGGSVSTFSAGNLAPLFTAAVADPTTTPALSFTLSTAAAYSWFGNATGSTAAPAYNTSVLPASLMPALTGDVTNSAGALATTIANDAVTFAKFQEVNALSLFGNPTGALANGTNITIEGGGQLSDGKLKFYNASSSLSGTTPAPDAFTAKIFIITLTGNTTFTFVNFEDGDSIAIRVKQAAAGGPYTVAFPAANWQGGTQPTQTVTANKSDWYSFQKTAAGIDAMAQQNF